MRGTTRAFSALQRSLRTQQKTISALVEAVEMLHERAEAQDDLIHMLCDASTSLGNAVTGLMADVYDFAEPAKERPKLRVIDGNGTCRDEITDGRETGKPDLRLVWPESAPSRAASSETDTRQ